MKKLLLLAAVAILMVSCTQEATLSVSADVASFQFDAEGGEFDSIIFTNGSWTASCEDEDIVFSPASGDYTTPMHIVVAPNEEHRTKVVPIVLKATLDNLTRTAKIVITQQCRPFIFCDEAVKTIDAAGGIVRFSVNSNETWHVADATACLVDPMTGGPNLTDVYVSVPANATGAPRTLSVILALDSTPETTVVLTLSQEA